MRRTRLDPAPRHYPEAVTLLRRSARGRACAPAQVSLDDVIGWLLTEASSENDTVHLFESFVWHLVAAGLPLARSSLHIGTLHPELIGYAWVWNVDDGLCDEIHVQEAALRSEAYKRNPVRAVLEDGQTFCGRTDDFELRARHPILDDFARQGLAEYIIKPLNAGSSHHNAVSLATKRASGFTDAETEALDRALKLFALHVSRHIVLRISANLLDTYVGTVAGSRVLGGEIRRGSGQSIRSIIWISDMRDFTSLSDKLPPEAMTRLLNAYFERLAGAVVIEGGEILKFIGDGLLAIFPLDAFEDGDTAARAALRAAEMALLEAAALGSNPPADLADIEGWAPLRTGIALHEGCVFFGNVGSPERLDFTVIGAAVNMASRVEALCKSLGRSLLLTEPVARRLACTLDDLGGQSLRGVAQPITVYAVPGI